MTKKLFVYSTLTADQRYTNWKQGGADMPVPDGEVFVKGGAGVVNDRLWTPRGTVTEITEEDRAILESNSDFLLHKENGFVEISEELVAVEKAAADMESRDGASPLLPEDLPADQQPTLPPLPPLREGDAPVAPAKSANAAKTTGKKR